MKTVGHNPLPEPYRECEVNGSRLYFDYCGTDDLQYLIDFYDNANYIGSGFRAWYNGVLNEFDETHHFFVKK